MKIKSLHVENFRGLRHATIEDAGTAVVIAGPNGSGKSCLLDAIRLFKSVYGSYNDRTQDEVELWKNEFQLSWDGRLGDLRGVIRDRSKPTVIEGRIQITEKEKQFILGAGQWMIQELAWRTLFPNIPTYMGQVRAVVTRDVLKSKDVVKARGAEWLQVLKQELRWREVPGKLTIDPSGATTILDCLTLRLMFRFFVPEEIGIIDYHGSHRNYAREQLHTIKLRETNDEERVKSAALYNYETKYATLKGAMAGEYVRELLDREAKKTRTATRRPLSDTLKELFSMFLPGKTFEGPIAEPGGELSFPVWVDEETRHDINELSSGEKEILFAYLRARTLAPRQSVLLIDEPELHLNPGLVQGLPQFYEKYIGRELENQIWLVTHSDRFLREALDTVGMGVYHMQHGNAVRTGNQIRRVENRSSIEQIIIDLAGDLAAYKPDGRIVLLEGADSRFDEKMVTRLFPEVAKRVNFVSAGNKKNVLEVQKTIEQMMECGQVQVEANSIVDPDDALLTREPARRGRRREWGCYHIENYLLNAEFIGLAVKSIDIDGSRDRTEESIERLLEDAAEELITNLAVRQVRDKMWRGLRKEMDMGSGNKAEPAAELRQVLAATTAQVQNEADRWSQAGVIEKEIRDVEARLRQAWESGEWRKKFPGRNILDALCAKLGGNIEGKRLRIAIVGEMAKAGFKPEGMAKIIESIEE